MIQPDGLVKLVDLGIAKSEDIKDSLCTESESVFGTPAYVAPEQAIDASVVDTRADIYSLGVVLFEIISGKVPYDGPNAPQILAQTLSNEPFPDIRDIVPDVKPELAVIIRRMCVKEHDRRIPSPSVLIAEFAKIGYQLRKHAKENVRFVPSAESAPTIVSMRSLIGKGVEKSESAMQKDTLTFETQDVEIQQFVRGLKRRKKMRKLAYALALGLMTFLGILLFSWLLGVT